MKKETEKVINILKNEYGLNTDKIIKEVIDDIDSDFVNIDDVYFAVHKGLSDNQLNDTASYIYSSIDEQSKTHNLEETETEDKNVTQISEANDTKKAKKYKYKPINIVSIDEEDDDEDFINEHKLQEIAKYEPYCIIKDTLVVSKEDNDEFLVISFNVPENDSLGLETKIPNYDKYEDFVVFPEDLEEVNDTKEVSESVKDDNIETEEETSTILLEALDSEKDAVMTYEKLIEESNNEEEIKLLQKILDDEKEHIALLSALQANKTADYVAKDNKELLDEYTEDTLEE